MKKNFNSLPDVPLRIIFGKLTLEELIPVRRVCTLWRFYQEKISSEVRSVTVLVGKKPLDLITESSLFIKHLHEVRKDDGKPMYEPQWDRKWAHITYKKNFRTGPFENAQYEDSEEQDPRSNTFRGHVSAQNIIKLLGTINMFPLLEHLTLDFQQELGADWDALFELDLSIIHRLREFYIATWDRRIGDIFDEWLKVTDEPEYRQRCRESRLERIGARIRDRDVTVMVYFGEQHPWAPKFTTIPAIDIGATFNPDYYNETLSTDFRSLTSLEYHYYAKDENFDAMLKVLAPLNQLISLTLIVHGLPPPEDGGPVDVNQFFALGGFRMMMEGLGGNDDFNFSLFNFDRMEPNKLAQLPSVRILTLRLLMKRHSDIRSRHWGWIFPSVQVLDVKHNCLDTPHGDCNHYDGASRDTVPESQLIDGIRELLRPFKEMPKLHTVHTHFPQDKKWTLDEI